MGTIPIRASAANTGTSAIDVTVEAGLAAWPYHWSTATQALSMTHMTRPAPTIR